MSEARAREVIAEQFASLDPAARGRVLNNVMEGLPAIVEKYSNPKNHRYPPGAIDQWLGPWLSPPFKLSRNECSRVHKVRESFERGGLVVEDVQIDIVQRAKLAGGIIAWLNEGHAFVVQHDWASAFKNASASGDHPDAVQLPYDACVFEFRINGRVVVFIGVDECINRITETHVAFVEHEREWWLMELTTPMLDYIRGQIRAICIALDAEVATREVIRAPAKLNRARAKENRPPLRDYHLIRLHGRITNRAEPMGGTHRSPRLHFRRGHWRHYETHTTWVRWTLAGDPDLGFIDKGYRL